MQIKTMLAAILVEQKKPLVVEEVYLPENLGVGQVLVKIHYSGICGSQLGEMDGLKGEDHFLPHLLGHEGSGTVLEVGPGVSHVKPKDKIVLHWRKGLGIESSTPKYKWQNKILNAGWITTFNEFAIISENRCTPIPAESEIDTAALFGCAVTTGFGVIENNAKLKMGESIVIFGSGGIGLNIVQAAALVNAYPIIAIDQHDNRLELASEMGATNIINSKNKDVVKKILKIVGSKGVDVFADNTGIPSKIKIGYNITKPQGRIILVGVPAKGHETTINTLPLHFGKVLTGSHGGDGNPGFDIPRYQNLERLRRIQLKPLITEVNSLENINKSIERLRSGEISGRTLIKMK